MKMFDIRKMKQQFLVAIIAALSLSGCDSVIYDDQGDCSVNYRVSFRYVRNIVGADAFGPQVADVNLYVYDKSGNLALKKTETRELSVDNGFYMDIDLQPGTYDMIAWCEGRTSNPETIRFAIGSGEMKTALNASLTLGGISPDLYSDKDIVPLFHGIATDVVLPDTYGTIDLDPIMLTKDTNRISVILQNINGDPVDRKDYLFRIEGSNSELTHINIVTGTPHFFYHPWSVEEIAADFEYEESVSKSRASITVPNGVMAQLTTGRLMADMEQKLTVSRSDTGEPIFSIPLIRYLLLVKGKYDGIDTDQDYLDCNDTYSLVFFVDGNMKWMKSRIFINNWRVVPPQDEEL